MFEADIDKSFFSRAFGIVLQLLPAALIIAAAQLYALSHTTGLHGATNPWGWYVLTQPYVWRSYFYTFFLPIHLSADTDWKVILHLNDERLWKGLIFLLFIVLSLCFTWRRPQTQPVAFGIIWFVAALLPTSLVPFAEVTNDHRMYFPFVGLAITVVCFCGVVFISWQARYKHAYKLGGVLMCLVLIFNAYGVYQRNKVWHTEESLWRDVTVKSPQNGRGLMNYGLTQMSQARYDVAALYFTRAQKLLPYYSTLYINIGVLKGATGKPTEADHSFRKAIAYGPDSFEPYAFYARYLSEQHRDMEAKTMARKALALNPRSSMAQQVIKQTNSDYQPKTPEEWLDASLVFYQSGRYDDCIKACRQALKLKPDYADAWNNIGACHNQMKQWIQAISALEKALNIDPNHKLAKANLEWARKGRLNSDLQIK